MILTIIIAFISLIALVILHELGHFLMAKKFGVKVEEFGIGYPPRIFGKKIGETIYSLNLLPLGGFVKIYGHEGEAKGPRSFRAKPIWQRALIILGGIISFWIIAAVILSVVMALGVPTVIEDRESLNLIDPKVQVVAVALNSPAKEAGLEIGDIIRELKSQDSKFETNKVVEVQEFIEVNKGEEIILTIQRGGKIFDVSLTPRIS